MDHIINITDKEIKERIETWQYEVTPEILQKVKEEMRSLAAKGMAPDIKQMNYQKWLDIHVDGAIQSLVTEKELPMIV